MNIEYIGGKKIFSRICCSCNKKILHTDKSNCIRLEKNNALCKSCSHKGEKNWNYGLSSWNKGKKLSKLHRIKLSLSHRGQCSCMKGKSHTEETKYKIRTSVINDLRKKGIKIGYINYNPMACKFFDKLNVERNWNLQHAMNGGEIELYGYLLDAYDKNKNIIVEYDESRHHKPLYYKKDLERQNRIIKYFKEKNTPVQFWRYDELYDTLKQI